MAKPKLQRIEGFEWNLEALMNPETYFDEVWRGRALNLPGVGRLGVSCPKCWLSISADGAAKPKSSGGVKFCQCDEKEFDRHEIMATLGFGHLKLASGPAKAQVV